MINPRVGCKHDRPALGQYNARKWGIHMAEWPRSIHGSMRDQRVRAHARTRARTLASCVTLVLASAAAQAQESTPSSSTELEEVVVTGFRSSLNSALEDKRNETAAIDSVKAEDIGKFPDSNLAESMQRVPGVTLSRGDGGEGRNISVRGLGPAFTRVRINGMEGAAQTGSSDIYGAGNNGRSFDFNVFP